MQKSEKLKKWKMDKVKYKNGSDKKQKTYKHEK